MIGWTSLQGKPGNLTRWYRQEALGDLTQTLGSRVSWQVATFRKLQAGEGAQTSPNPQLAVQAR